MKIDPRNDYVLVQTDIKEECSRGGIFLPEKSQEERLEATVIAVGPGGINTAGLRIPIDLLPKDRVIIHQFAGQQIGDEDEHLFLIKQESILCKIL